MILPQKHKNIFLSSIGKQVSTSNFAAMIYKLHPFGLTRNTAIRIQIVIKKIQKVHMTQTLHRKEFPFIWGECSHCQTSKGLRKLGKKDPQFSLCSCLLIFCQCFTLAKPNRSGQDKITIEAVSSAIEQGKESNRSNRKMANRKVKQEDGIEGRNTNNPPFCYLYIEEGEKSFGIQDSARSRCCPIGCETVLKQTTKFVSLPSGGG